MDIGIALNRGGTGKDHSKMLGRSRLEKGLSPHAAAADEFALIALKEKALGIEGVDAAQALLVALGQGDEKRLGSQGRDQVQQQFCDHDEDQPQSQPGEAEEPDSHGGPSLSSRAPTEA